jgi:hypothetical protein
MKTPFNLCNTAVRAYIAEHHPDVYDYDSFTHLVPANIKDRLYGATKQGDWNVKTSDYRVFMLLAQLDNINNESVGKLMNPKQEALYGQPLNVRSLQRWCAVLACASGAIAHYLHDLSVSD